MIIAYLLVNLLTGFCVIIHGTSFDSMVETAFNTPIAVNYSIANSSMDIFSGAHYNSNKDDSLAYETTDYACLRPNKISFYKYVIVRSGFKNKQKYKYWWLST